MFCFSWGIFLQIYLYSIVFHISVIYTVGEKIIGAPNRLSNTLVSNFFIILELSLFPILSSAIVVELIFLVLLGGSENKKGLLLKRERESDNHDYRNLVRRKISKERQIKKRSKKRIRAIILQGVIEKDR